MEDQPHPATIHDLPLHILHDIFWHFQDPHIEPKGRINFRTSVSYDNRNTLRNARLVCHLFNNVASPFLFSIVGVELTQESLDQLVRFSKSSPFAQHARGVEVWLDYRPGEIAADIATFSAHCQPVLRRLHGECYSCGQEDSEFDEPWTPGPLSPNCELFQAICACWDEACGVSEDNTIPNDDPLMKEYQDVLREAFDLYCQGHEEQLGLIISGSFVQTISSCVSQMPNAHALALLDENMGEYREWGKRELIHDQRSLVGILQRPLSWKKIENFTSETEDSSSDLDLDFEFPAIPEAIIMPARILTELPIALHNSGATLRDLYVGSFPCRGNFHAICAPNNDDSQASTIWTDLQAACQNLRSVSFGERHQGRYIRYNHLTDTESMYVNQFVGSILCSRELEVVGLSFSMLGLNKNGEGSGIGAYEYDMTSGLSTVRSPLLRRLILRNATVGCSELTALCAGLGNSLEKFYIFRINLQDGNWASILDSLRAKVKGSCYSRRIALQLASLTGGEFEAYSPPPPRDDHDLYFDWGRVGCKKWQAQANAVNVLAEEYVSGVEDMQNPFSTASHILAQEKYERLLESRR